MQVKLWFLVWALLLTVAAQAQSRPSSQDRANGEDSPATMTSTQSAAAVSQGPIRFTGNLRARLEKWGWFETTAADSAYTFGALVLRLGLTGEHDRIDWQIEGAFPLLINLPTNSIAPAPQGQLGLGASYFAASGRQDAAANLKQAFIRLKWRGGDRSSSLRVGRFEFSDGTETAPAHPTLATLKRDQIAQRLIGPFGFTHIGRSFDGLHFVTQNKSTNFTFVGARPTEGVFQLRSLKELDVDFYYGALTHHLPAQNSQSEMRLFALHYHDGRRVLKADNRPQLARQNDLEKIRLTTLGGHFISAVKAGGGTADFLLWGVGQFGSWGELDHRAGAIAIEAGYQFDTAWKPWLRGGYFYGSGDGNPADDRHTTFFQVLPTPRIYARLPFYNLMNNQDLFAQLRVSPDPRFRIRADLRYLRLSKAEDLWYGGGGAFQRDTFGYTGRPSGGTRSLGVLGDISFDFDLTRTTGLSVYFGGVRGGRVQSSIYPQGGSHPGARFVFIELTQRF